MDDAQNLVKSFESIGFLMELKLVSAVIEFKKLSTDLV
jgi:hypothetical protein